MRGMIDNGDILDTPLPISNPNPASVFGGFLQPALFGFGFGIGDAQLVSVVHQTLHILCYCDISINQTITSFLNTPTTCDVTRSVAGARQKLLHLFQYRSS